ncbi:MAG: VOC family protein [Chloroflexia bacterium]|nr:VOC family protein [Chloroflexia bacterium]
MSTGVQVVFDCAEPQRMANFWAAAMGYHVQPPPEGFATWEEFLASIGVPEDAFDSASAIIDPDGSGPRIFFQKVPEHKTIKNRVHLDLNVGGGREVPVEQRRGRVDAEAERLATLGATTVRSYDENGEYWVAMLDPEGNEFDLQ